MKQLVDKIYKVIVICFFCFSVSDKVFSEEHYAGTFGKTYSISEPDAYNEILEKVKKIDMLELTKKIQKKLPEVALVKNSISKATETKVRYFVPKFTLDVDIPDGKGGILYPKGYTFNPLEYIQLRGAFLFFDANSATQIQWIKTMGYNQDLNITFLATEGDVLKASKLLETSVYKATPIIIKKFNIVKSPSYVRQVGKALEITEISQSDMEKEIQKKRNKQ
ncbi:MAG: hypothetical protein QXV73_04215 [Candidatus Micrarchaeia archaeon]